MMVIPRRETVRLVYAGRAASDGLGMLLSAGALAAIGLAVRRERRAARAPAAPVVVAMPSEDARAGRRWGGVVPGLLLLVLILARLRPDPAVKARDQELDRLYDKASKAYAAERFTDAAEYARHAVLAGPQSPLRFELLCLRGESLLRAAQPLEAAQAFEEVLQGPPNGPHVPQALFSAAAAREAAGDETGALAHRQRLLKEFGKTPWAERLREAGKAP
jgi:TolA-binding protein